MNKYPLCEQLGVLNVIYPSDLEAILRKATVVYGSVMTKKDEYEWSQSNLSSDTHTALLIGIKPVKEKTLAEKISDILSDTSLSSPVALIEIKKIIEAE